MEYLILIGVLLVLSIIMAIDLSWTNVLAPARNEMVFADRHQDYGAFTLRRDYVRGLAIAVVGSLLFFGAAVSIPKVIAMMSGDEEVVAAKKIVDVDLDLFEEEKKEEPPPPPPIEPPPPVKVEVVQFTELVASDDPVEEPPPVMEELVETNVGTFNQEGEKIVAPPPPPPPVDEPTFDLASVQEQPEFPGGLEEMYKYLGKNTKYPAMEKDAAIQGKVYIEFVVSSSGAITDVTLKRGVSAGLDKEALRVVKSLPKWSPGKMNGKAVKVRYILPVVYTLK